MKTIGSRAGKFQVAREEKLQPVSERVGSTQKGGLQSPPEGTPSDHPCSRPPTLAPFHVEGACDECHRKFDAKAAGVAMAPMLLDRVWQQLARQDETLCGHCMFKRAASRRVRLTLADLHPCLFNLYGAPFSWFDFFATYEPTPPKNLRQWQNALRRLSPRLLRWSQTAGRHSGRLKGAVM